jgi:hypothetical protein
VTGIRWQRELIFVGRRAVWVMVGRVRKIDGSLSDSKMTTDAFFELCGVYLRQGQKNSPASHAANPGGIS